MTTASAVTDETLPDLYCASHLATGVTGWDRITDTQVQRYREQGYLVVNQAFTANEIEAAKQGIHDLIERHETGDYTLEFEPRAKAILATLSAEERQDAVRKLMSFVPAEPRLEALALHPSLLAAVERLLGSPPTLFQDMALLKPPQWGREKPWHQDHAYFDFPLGTPIVGVWIALDEATLENGCMFLLEGEHYQGPRLHFQRRDWQICDTEMQDRRAVAVPLQPGGCLLFDGLLPHGTPPNRTSQRRRAVQFHYIPADAARCSSEERLRLFGGEGRNVAC